jgi:hypothetical protein
MPYLVKFWGKDYSIEADNPEEAAQMILEGPAFDEVNYVPEADDYDNWGETDDGEGSEVQAYYTMCGDGCCSGLYIFEVYRAQGPVQQ